MKRVIILIAIMCFTTTLFAQNYKFGKVSKAELEEKLYPLDSTANAAYLLKRKTIHFEYDGTRGWSLITKVHERIKIYNKKGYEFATKSIRLYKDGGVNEKLTTFKAITYNQTSKGKIAKAKLAKKELFIEKAAQNWKYHKFTMPNIQPGSIIEWEYITRSPFWTQIDNVLLQDFIPIKKVIASVRIPEYFVFKKHQKGFLPMNVLESKKNTTFLLSFRVSDTDIRRKGGGRSRGMNGGAKSKGNNKTFNATTNENIYKIDKTNIPALKKERFVNNYQNYVSMLTFELSKTNFPRELERYYSTTWEDVSLRIKKSSYFGEELIKKNYFKDDLELVITGKNTESEKINAILHFVKSKVAWNKYTSIYKHKGVRKAYKNGVGNVADINLMLTSMLRFAGLQANPVLVSTKSHGIPLFPTLKGFNYVIASVVLKNGETILLDATEKYSLPNILPVRVLNWKGRLIKKNGDSHFIDLVPKKHALEDNNITVTVSEDGSLSGMMRSRYTNQNALKYRKATNHLNKESINILLEEKYNIEIDDFKISNKDIYHKPIGQIISFKITDATEVINKKLFITPLLFLANKINLFKSKTRVYPVDFETPWRKKNTILFQIPENYKVTSIPKSLAIGLPDNLGVFKYQIITSGNKIKIISILQINKASIGQQNYEELKQFYKTLVEKQTEKIVLEKM